MRTRSLCAVAAFALAAPLAAQSVPSPHTEEYQAVQDRLPAAAADEQTDLAFKTDTYSRMTVPVRFTGRGSYRFLIDTGADRTSISKQLAQRLNLPAGRRALLHSITSASEIETAKIPAIELGKKTLWLSDAPLLERANMGADGILGTDSLRSQRVLFDFRAQTVSLISATEKLLPEERNTIVVQGRRKNGRLILTRATAEGVPLELVVDTGAQISVGNEALRRSLVRSGRLRSLGKAEMTSVTGETFVGEQLVVADLKVGSVELRGLPIIFGDAHAFKPLGLAKRPALLLGMNAISSFDKVSIDFERKRLRLLLPARDGMENQRLAFR
jgi:predicted aspartyl protease